MTTELTNLLNTTKAIAAWRKGHPNAQLDLAGHNLNYADLSYANLDYADLDHTDLSYAKGFYSY